MIDEELLKRYGASQKEYVKNEIIFFQDEAAQHYFQVASGNIKMNNYNDEGKEFIQGIFSKGRSFGEPPLFGSFKYPANATAIEKSVVWRLGKVYFYQLLKENPEVHLSFTEVLAHRLHYKALMATEISSHTPDHRILTLLDYLKKEIYQVEGAFKYQVELTRQQIADLTGLRVETVIRSIKKLEEQGALKISNRKVYR